MKSLKPRPTPPRVAGAASGARPRAQATGRTPRALATAAVALVACAILAFASSSSASRLTRRAGLEGTPSSTSPHQTGVEAARVQRSSVVSAARATHAAPPPAAGWLTAAPLFTIFQEEAAESVATYDADCETPKTVFALGERVCVKTANAAVGFDESPTAPPFPLRKISLINPGGFEVGSALITSPTQSATFTLPTATAANTVSFGDEVVDNRGQWRVNINGLFDSYQRASAPFTVSDPARKAVDLSVVTTQEQALENVPGGAQAPFLIFVENRGPDAAADVVLSIPVPNFSSFFGLMQSDGPAFDCVNPNVGTGPSGTSVCTIGSLPAGMRATFTAIYLVSTGAATGAKVTNTPAIESPTTERHLPDNVSAASYTVARQPLCTITTPADVTVDTAAGETGAVVNYEAPTGTGNCGTVTCDMPSGTFFPLGETYVTCSNPQQDVLERFKVTVNDTQAPVITCPADLSVPESAPGSGSAVVNFPAPGLVDNDPNIQVTFDPPSGLPLDVGEHTVTATATDVSGNADTCTFKVTVTERLNDCTITPDVATLPALTADCSLVLSNIPTAVDSCGGRIGATTDDPRFYDTPGTYTVHWKYSSSGQTVTQEQTVTITSGSGALSITGPPTVQVGGGSCPIVIGDLAVTLDLNIGGGSCGNSDVTYNVTPAAPGNVFRSGTTYTVVSTVSDGAASASVTQTLVVGGNDPAPTVTAPADASYECPANVPSADASQATAADNCGAPTVTVSETNNGGAGSAASPLIITRTFTATDSGGKTASDAQVITVIDNTPPAITAPGDKTVNADPAACAIAVDLGSPTSSDNCNAHVTNNAPALFPLGVTTVTWTATDDAGNTATATQKVTVVDVTAPVITINGASPLVVECHTSFADPGASAADACDSNVPVTATGAVDVNTPGTYTITYTAADDSGNQAAAVTRTVNVVDTTAPVIACPTDITVTLPPNTTAVSMPVGFAVTATDSCDGTPAVALSHAPGSIFPVGTTTVTATATDDSGNASSCSFNVTVLYLFSGFFSPVDNPPTLNQVNAGRAIPVKFSLSGNKGLSIFDADSPSSQQVNCSTTAPISDVEETVTAGNSSLTYDAGSDRYHYVWKTNSAWAGTCRQLNVKLNDGSNHTALFKFK